MQGALVKTKEEDEEVPEVTVRPAAAQETRVDAAVAAVLSELDGISTFIVTKPVRSSFSPLLTFFFERPSPLRTLPIGSFPDEYVK